MWCLDQISDITWQEERQTGNILSSETSLTGGEGDACLIFMSALFSTREMSSMLALLRICRGSSFLMPRGTFSVKD
jgi:hypothetical protein